MPQVCGGRSRRWLPRSSRGDSACPLRHICAVVVVRDDKDGDEVLSLPWLWLPWIDGTDPSPFLVGCIATLCHSRDEILIEQLRQTQLDSSDQRNPCDHHEPNNRLAKPRLYTPFWVFVRFCCSFADDRQSLSLSLHPDGRSVKSGNRRQQPPETPAASPRVLHHGGRWSFSLLFGSETSYAMLVLFTREAAKTPTNNQCVRLSVGAFEIQDLLDFGNDKIRFDNDDKRDLQTEVFSSGCRRCVTHCLHLYQRSTHTTSLCRLGRQ